MNNEFERLIGGLEASPILALEHARCLLDNDQPGMAQRLLDFCYGYAEACLGSYGGDIVYAEVMEGVEELRDRLDQWRAKEHEFPYARSN